MTTFVNPSLISATGSTAGQVLMSGGTTTAWAAGCPIFQSVAALRANTTSNLSVCEVVSYYGLSTATPPQGKYHANVSDTTSTDNGGSIIVDTAGIRWYLLTEGTVSVIQFGAYGDDTHDDTAAIQAAINFTASLSTIGTVKIPARAYKVQSQQGVVSNIAFDDGIIHYGGTGTTPITATTAAQQAYCLMVPSGVTLVAEQGACFNGNYTYGNTSLSELICIAFLSGTVAQNIGVHNLTFNNYFFGIGAIGSIVATSQFSSLQFNSCAFGFYASALERCSFAQILSQNTGVVCCVGGQWVSRDNNYTDLNGGYCDKTSFTDINNIYGRVMGTAEASIDSYFDTYFFKTTYNTSRLSGLEQPASVATLFPYLGICGRCIYVMSRYSRPSNGNTLRNISHAYAPRPSVYFAISYATNGDGFYLESCGYQDNINKINPIGVGFTDPYLGAGVIQPYFIFGLFSTSPVAAQFVYATTIVAGASIRYPDASTATTTVNANNSIELNSPLLVNSTLSVTGNVNFTSTGAANIQGVGLRSIGFGYSGSDTGIPTSPANSCACLLLVSRNTGSGTSTASSVSLLNFANSGGTAPTVVLVSGTSGLFTLSVSTSNTVIISSTTANNYSATFIGNQPL